jgi:hypothetical protein
LNDLLWIERKERTKEDEEENEENGVMMVMLDQLCLPGCEGGAVFNRFGALLGVSRNQFKTHKRIKNKWSGMWGK